jgi:(2Fe-2S) ferredoxin
MVVYPEGVFYGNVQLEDVSEITEQHLIGDQIVSRLQIG